MDESEGEKVVGGCDDHLRGSPLGVYADVFSHQTTERSLSEIIRQLSVREEAPTKEEICSLWNEARGPGCVSVAFDVGRLLVRLPLTEIVNSLPDFSVILTNDSVLLSALISKAISVKDKKATAKLCDYVRAEHVDQLESLFTLFEDLVRTDQREESDAAAIALYVVTDQTIGDVTTESVRRKRNDCLRLALSFTDSRFVRKCGSAALAKIVARDAVWTDYLIVVDTLEEPQSHLIRPILSKFDVLLAAINPTDDTARKDPSSIPFTWEWLQIAFAKSIRHTNGWVRLWTFEKILTIPAEHFSVDFAFVFDDFLSLINDNDVFWRLDDEGRLTDFINNLGVFLARVAAAIDSFSIESNENVRFYGRLLTLFDSPWSPFPLLFVSRALKTLPIFPAFASKIHFEQMRRILQFVANLQYIPLRLVALTNFSVLFIRLICWTDDVLPQLPSLLSFLPATLLERDQTIPHTINSILAIPGSSMLSTPNASASLQSIFLHTSDQHVDEMLSAARVLWLISDAQDTANSVWDEICVLMAEALSDADDLAMLTAPTELQTDVLLAVWLSRAKIHATPESLMEMIRRYLDMRLYSLNGSATDRSLLDKLYRPCLSIVDNSDEAVHMSSALTLLTTQASNLSFPKQALLLRIATLDAVEKSSVDCQLIEQYLSSSENVQVRTIEVDCDKNYKHLMTSQFQADRWRLRLRSGAIESASSTAAEDLLRECMSTLDSCYSWLERSALFDIIKILLVKVISNADLALEALKCARVVVEEQRKSESYIPALRAFLNLVFSKEVLSCAAISEYAREIFTEFRSTADLNSMVALVLGEALEHSVDMLDSNWVDIVVDMCLFGPVPKKDDRVMYAAYEMARSDSTNKADNGNLAMVHKAPQKARAASVCCLLQLLAKGDAKLIAAIVTVTITKSTEFDSSKGISFGLSLAHRQKTRAAQLLLLVVDHCDEKYACKAFDHCLDSLLDSSQQYSIKLLVEWTLVRICLKHDQLKETLWRAEATLAKRRIGSVTSWLSALMHLAIASRSQADVRRCFERFLPWCSAQNFAVRCVAIGALKRLWNYADDDLKTQMTIVEGLLNFDMESA
uniref:Uncharacterized protein n=1 Tax=Plectus sambesii TaxID=2011161 RepID=A0A914WBF1_9BILA